MFHLLNQSRKQVIAVVTALVAVVVLAPPADAATVTACANPTPAEFPSLGSAAGFAALAINGTGVKQAANFSADTIDGDVGVASGATVTNQAPSTVNGSVYVDSGGSFSGPGKVSGLVDADQDLAVARSDALAASVHAAQLSATFAYANITSNTTVTGVAGLNVVTISGSINLNNASLILSGPANAFFVVNVAGSITLNGTGGIQVGGAVPTSQLVVNMTGSGNLINTHIGNVVQGILLRPNVGGSLDGAFGSLLLGGTFSLLSGVRVTFEGCNYPAPVVLNV